MEERERERVIKALRDAVESGLRAITSGGAVDAVVEAVKVLEDSGLFDAGIGSVYSISGRVQMDAGVMDGKTGRAGAVAAVEGVRNPVVLAKRIMRETEHVLVAGEGAAELARAWGLVAPLTLFYNDGKNKRFEEMKREAAAGGWHYKKVMDMARALGLGDTVGAVALDKDGNLAAATSTGGVWLKLDGRVGDSPIPGAGYWAENGVGAFSATGVGEYILLSLPSFRAAQLVKSGAAIDVAVRETVAYVTERFGSDTIGLLGIDSRGNIAAEFNTAGMARAWGKGREVKRAAIGREDWP